MTIDNLDEALKAFRSKNIPVKVGFDGPVIGHIENVRAVEGSGIMGDVIIDDGKPLPPGWLALPKIIKIRG